MANYTKPESGGWPRKTATNGSDHETIAAIATPAGSGGIGIIRVSGSQARAIGQQLSHGAALTARQARFSRIFDGSGKLLDKGLLLFFQAPSSLTGEDTLEIQGHGGRVVLQAVLWRVMELGARPARPGEFTERAFFNNKIDLVEAEAVADLIAANSVEALHAAARSLEGGFSKQIREIQSQVVALRVNLEGMIDFPDEAGGAINDSLLLEAKHSLDSLLIRATRGAALNKTHRVVILGRTNAGKSSLFNRLTEKHGAIVSDTPGTTRDILRQQLNWAGLVFEVVDTAGIHQSEDAVEQEGIRRAKRAAEEADLQIYVCDARQGWQQDDEETFAALQQKAPHIARMVVHNKIDLVNDAPQTRQHSKEEICLSAKDGKGVNLLRDAIVRFFSEQNGEEDVYMARARHLDHLSVAVQRLEAALMQHKAEGPIELIAEELRLAQRALGGILGEYTSDALLGEIFSQFCVGK